MNATMEYIFGTMGLYEKAICILIRQMKNQRGFNRLLMICLAATCGYDMWLASENNLLDKKLVSMEREIEELKRSKENKQCDD